MDSDVLVWDVLRVMLILYGLLAMVINGVNLRTIRSYGEDARRRNAVRGMVAIIGFIVAGIAEEIGRLSDPLTWRLPALFLCYSAYLWTQLASLAEIRQSHAETLTKSVIQAAEVDALREIELEQERD